MQEIKKPMKSPMAIPRARHAHRGWAGLGAASGLASPAALRPLAIEPRAGFISHAKGIGLPEGPFAWGGSRDCPFKRRIPALLIGIPKGPISPRQQTKIAAERGLSRIRGDGFDSFIFGIKIWDQIEAVSRLYDIYMRGLASDGHAWPMQLAIVFIIE